MNIQTRRKKNILHKFPAMAFFLRNASDQLK